MRGSVVLSIARVAAVLGLAGSLFLPGEARAGGPPDVAALEKQGAEPLLMAVDRYHNGYPTQKWVFRMTLKTRSGEKRELRFSTWQKGEKRLIRFLEPGEVKGMSVLIRGGGTMYVYSPQTDNVRRVATHARRQTFMGSDFTMDDMGQINFHIDYDATFAEQTGEHLWLELRRKEGREIQWEQLRLRISRKTSMIDTIEYFEAGKKVKVQDRSRHGAMGGVSTYQHIAMTDQASGHQTIVEMLEQTIGDDIPNDVFTKRSLVRGQ